MCVYGNAGGVCGFIYNAQVVCVGVYIQVVCGNASGLCENTVGL